MVGSCFLSLFIISYSVAVLFKSGVFSSVGVVEEAMVERSSPNWMNKLMY